MLLNRFIANVSDKKLFSPTDRLLIAVSGGVDSVVLCDLCHTAGFRFEIAHANFQLRGQDSMMDECFVKGLSEQYRVPVHIRRFDTAAYSATHRVSVQVAARELRYDWFSMLLEKGGWLLTAHHADDNIETVLMNFFRGTGLTGLRGIQMKHDRLIRPLLPFGKAEILQYAKERKLNWREDASNAGDKYSRNYFRNAVLPMVYKIYPEAEQNMINNIARFADAEQLFTQAIAQHKKSLLELKGNEVHIPVLKLKKAVPLNTILYEIIKAFDFTSHQVNDVLRLLDAEQAAFVQSATHKIFRNRKWLIISPIEAVAAQNVLIESAEKQVKFNGHKVDMKLVPADILNLSKHAGTAELDSHKIIFPLLLRKWKAGDYFYPLGMKKKKKVSRFLIDNKLSPTEKEKIWVLESNKKICWVVGMRIDERFKIVPSTQQMLKVTVS